MTLLTFLDLYIVDLLRKLLKADMTKHGSVDHLEMCYHLIETNQLDVGKYLHEDKPSGVDAYREYKQNALKQLSAHEIAGVASSVHSIDIANSDMWITERDTAEEFVERFRTSLNAALCTTHIKSSSVLGVYIRKLQLTAQSTELKHWIVLQEKWDVYSGRLDHKCHTAIKAKVSSQTVTATTTNIRPYYATTDLVSSNMPRRDTRSCEDREIETAYRMRWSFYDTYVTAWRSGEYSSSIEHLHRHFDYLPRQFGRLNVHYALLDLALLLVDAGSEREALWAICEAIDAARDNHDHDCLAFALEWLRSMAQHDLCVSKAYFNLLSRQGRAHTMRISYDSRICTVEPTQCSIQSPTVAGRLGKLRSIERSRLNSAYRRLALVDSWSDLDLEQLKNISLRLALAESLSNVETEAAVRVRCAVAVTVFSTGDTARARRILDAMPRSAMQNHKLHKIWLTQHAIFRLAQDSELEEDLLLELQEIRRDPMTIGPRVRRLIAKNLLVEAKDLLEGYLKPSFAIASTDAGSRRRILLLQLSSEIYLKSSEPDRALIALVHAIKLAHKGNLYKVYRELMESMSRIARLLDK